MKEMQFIRENIKNFGSEIIRYFQLTPRLYKVIGLEFFVFSTFIGICAMINEVILIIPSTSPNPGVNFLFALLKVGISILLIIIWLFIWYYLTKKLMKQDKKTEKEEKI